MLAGRAVVDPEKNHPHLIEPQQVRQAFLQVGRDLCVASCHSQAQVFDGLFADRAGLLAERGKRVLAVGSVAKESIAKFAVGLQQLKALLQNAADAIFHLLVLLHFLEHSFVAALLHFAVESQHNRLFGCKIIVSSAQRHTGFLGNVPHGGLLEALFAEKLKSGVVDLAARVFCPRRTVLLCSLGHRR